MSVDVRPVRGRADATRFVRLPHQIYRDIPQWVAPLERDLRRLLSPRRNPFFQTGEAELFLARRGRDVVGRIAAVIEPRHNELHDPKQGFFGLFEAIDDTEVARALFDAAAGWLGDRGYESLLGPCNFTINDEIGVLVEGFERPPVLMTPYNPPYYPTLFEACGFAKAKDLYGWLFDVPDGGELAPALTRAADRFRRQDGLTVRHLDPKNFAADLALVWQTHTEAWADNWGAVPLTRAEFEHLARALRSLLRPECVILAEIDGEVAGCVVNLPDVNQALACARGRLTRWGLPLGLLRIWLASRRISQGRGLALGVTPKFRGRGLDAILYVDGVRAAHRLGWTQLETAWTLEDNHQINRGVARIGMRRARTYRLYVRATARQAA